MNKLLPRRLLPAALCAMALAAVAQPAPPAPDALATAAPAATRAPTTAPAAAPSAAPTAAPAATRPRSADPLDSTAPVPPLRWRSTLSRAARPSPAASAASWREANDNTARIGGWKAYAREAQAQPSQQQEEATP